MRRRLRDRDCRRAHVVRVPILSVAAMAISVASCGIVTGLDGYNVIEDCQGEGCVNEPGKADATPIDRDGVAVDETGTPPSDGGESMDAATADAKTDAPVADAGPIDAGPYGTRVRTNLVALYEMEEGSGTTLNDTSSFGTPLPLTFTSSSAGDVTWTTKGAVSAKNNNHAHSSAPATKISSACETSAQVTLEAWATIGSTPLSSSARIITIATASDDFNAMMSTTHDSLIFGLFTTSGRDYTTTALGSGLKHIVQTFVSSTNMKKIYVNGSLVTTDTQAGNIDGWSKTLPLALFNDDALDRPMFPGAVHLVAIYSRALSQSEVSTNFAAGPDP